MKTDRAWYLLWLFLQLLIWLCVGFLVLYGFGIVLTVLTAALNQTV